jgi:hypothetical protein
MAQNEGYEDYEECISNFSSVMQVNQIAQNEGYEDIESSKGGNKISPIKAQKPSRTAWKEEKGKKKKDKKKDKKKEKTKKE